MVLIVLIEVLYVYYYVYHGTYEHCVRVCTRVCMAIPCTYTRVPWYRYTCTSKMVPLVRPMARTYHVVLEYHGTVPLVHVYVRTYVRTNYVHVYHRCTPSTIDTNGSYTYHLVH